MKTAFSLLVLYTFLLGIIELLRKVRALARFLFRRRA